MSSSLPIILSMSKVMNYYIYRDMVAVVLTGKEEIVSSTTLDSIAFLLFFYINMIFIKENN
jgi:hypothetical protein